jgi:hypothetical protein
MLLPDTALARSGHGTPENRCIALSPATLDCLPRDHRAADRVKA